MSEQNKVIDPVCGMQVDPATAQHHTRYQGQNYYFCWEGCLKKFEANPAAFVGGPGADPPVPVSLQTNSASSGQFTCPMHPQVVQIGPGACPLCGMALEPMTPTEADFEDDTELRDMTRRFRIAVALTVPIWILSMGPMLGFQSFAHSPLVPWLTLALSAPSVWWCGWPIWQRFADSMKNRSPNMFTLIGIGMGVSFLSSVVALVLGNRLPAQFLTHGSAPAYFESAATISAFVLLGQVLELRARRRAGGALRSLLALKPKTARRLAGDGAESEVALTELQVGDRVRIRPGESVPLDGVVLEGASGVDESLLSGEPYSVEKAAGDWLTGGTLNMRGALVMEVRKVGADTTLAQIVQQVLTAQRSQAPIQRIADKVSAYFVPAVVAVAILTFVAWIALGSMAALPFAIINAISVVVIACPCALGLATPVSIAVATGRAASSGILIRDAAVIEAMQSIRMVAFDKTGTLTEGKPIVTAVEAVPDLTAEAVLAAAAALEVRSEHPLAQAIIDAAKRRGTTYGDCDEFDYQPGKGLTGRSGADRVCVGTEKLLDEMGIVVAPQLVERAATLREQGNSVLFVGIGGHSAGLIALSDPVKPSASDALNKLRSLGIKTVMITGDNASTANVIASQLGFKDTQVFAGVLPSDKAQIIESWQASGRRVAMAGDGVNDAVALAAADVGIAMGSGSDVAVQSAGITLVRNDLNGVVRAFILSRATMSNIKQNLWFAFFYNTVGIVIATGIFYPTFGLLLNPMIAAAAMSISSACVITNALRLRSIRL